MSKIFRLYKEGPATYQDWNESFTFPYTPTAIDTIEDPEGASAKHEITSIPSPFARIDLIKSAFKEVCKPDRKSKKVNLDGETIFHKMVSDTLDIAEIFFNIDKYGDKIEIIKWDPSTMLSNLEESSIEGHRYLADALRKYMDSDALTYNFDKLQSIYILNYIQGPDELNVIGATSSATLFFSNANDLSFVKDIYFGEDQPFDSNYRPLFKREFTFVKYLFSLRKGIQNFAELFPEIDAYLSKTFEAITDQTKKNEILKITDSTIEDFDKIEFKDSQQHNFVEVLGYPLCKIAHRRVNVNSEFTIEPTIRAIGNLPLVLPIESGNKYADLQYTTGKWGKENKAPFKDEESDLSKRILPFDGTIKPYLTISDFLEDSIIRVPYMLNDERYFSGHIKIDKEKQSFLLPIKPLFFRYFSVDDLKGEMFDGKHMIEMDFPAGGCVKVYLRIPIKGNKKVEYIEYTRIYYPDSRRDIEQNDGNIRELDFTGFIMPLVKFKNEESAIYNVACIQSSKKNEFSFYKGEIKLTNIQKTCRDEDGLTEKIKVDNYFFQKSNFDYIQVHDVLVSGIIVPLFQKQIDTETFEFAIDLGTSNTHIEYKKGNNPSQVFSYNKGNCPLCEMFTPSKNEYGYLEDLQKETEIIEKDVIPFEIGEGDFKFPTRTVLSSSKMIDWDKTIYPFTLVNLPLTYDKRQDLPYNKMNCNIKWGKDNARIMESYVRCLLLNIRNWILFNEGDLSKTKIIWFYPLSMTPKRLNYFAAIWDKVCEEYFGKGVMIKRMTESTAPIQYFFDRYASTKSLINVDIGGGTTDVAFATDKDVKHITSFRFATNSLFEDSFSKENRNNGIIDHYKSELINVLEKYEMNELVKVSQNENNINHTANMASFLFGLKDNTLLREKDVDESVIDFNRILQEDENFKIVFIVFYTSIIYHIAQIVKNLGLDVPRHISFSGNGSKVIRIITTDTKLLANYTKLIFENVLEKPYGNQLDLLGLEKDCNPKNSTCKGGLVGVKEEDYHDKIFVLKGDGSGLVNETDTYESITNEDKKKMVRAIEEFYDFIFNNITKKFKFDDNFGVSPKSVDIAKKIAKDDILTYLDKGISQRCEESEKSDKIEETFFFYPIKGALQAMSTEIYNSLSNQ